ncbi:hypothetical protein BJ742DRAFT_852398 [Cladochytrium replicatum]|nr:hypothetical protein BJ742DRAFT_852398 [Cladochytrium replicatum]
MNNRADHGGMDVFTKNLSGAYHDDFYSNTKINWIAYKDDPAIFAWRLANEIRWGGASNNLARSPNCSSSTITAWGDEMSTYIKSLDSNQLLSVGNEGMGATTTLATSVNTRATTRKLLVPVTFPHRDGMPR